MFRLICFSGLVSSNSSPPVEGAVATCGDRRWVPSSSGEALLGPLRIIPPLLAVARSSELSSWRRHREGFLPSSPCVISDSLLLPIFGCCPFSSLILGNSVSNSHRELTLSHTLRAHFINLTLTTFANPRNNITNLTFTTFATIYS
ncbi:hypothetical protein HN51_070319, partial [Arachis hypogaea]